MASNTATPQRPPYSHGHDQQHRAGPAGPAGPAAARGPGRGRPASSPRRGSKSRPLYPQQPITPLSPLIDDILLTRYCIPGSVFLVEGIQTAPVSSSGRWQAVQLLLGDGLLCIQALLGAHMHRFVEVGEVAVGCYVRLDHFHVRWERVDVTQAGRGKGRGKEKEKDGDEMELDRKEEADEETMMMPRQMVYLVIEDLYPVGWDDTYLEMWRNQLPQMQQTESSAVAADNVEKGEVQDEHVTGGLGRSTAQDMARGTRKGMGETQTRTTQSTPRNPKGKSRKKDAAVEEAFDSFDTLTFPLKISPKKSQKHPAEQQHPPPLAASTPPNLISPSKRPPVSLPRDWHDLQTPLKLTTLRSIPHLPYAQNWSCNILAIVAALSPVEPSHLPPHRQRTARIADPSTAKQVHLTVFLEPDQFEPAVGSAVLLVGVKNHRFDGGSLKKYASDGPKTGGGGASHARWWYQDPWELAWCDVSGIKGWWAEMETASGSHAPKA